jgi:hypothetical protein
VHIIRRSHSVDKEDSDLQHGYFIELPRDGRITINGRTYINNVPLDDNSLALPFIIGPLNTYTIIELLSQPIFFFRTSDDLDFKNTLRNRIGNKISDEETHRRDTNGDVDAGGVYVTWTPIHVPLATQESLPVEQPPAEREYNDTWTENGESIGNDQDYLQNTLYAPFRKHYRDIFSSVLLSINDRQAGEAGFSVGTGAGMLRPGRTFLAPLSHPRERHHVLLVFRLDLQSRVTLHVLDPMAWQATAQDRRDIHENARQLLTESDWWLPSFTTAQFMLQNFPQTSQWIDCAQGLDRYELDMFTILNAWALALGLELLPAFNIEAHPVTFSNQAQIIFDLARGNQLDWKILYAFLVSHNYATSPSSADDTDDEPVKESLRPLRNRRFDLRVRSTEQLVTRQRAQDEAGSAGRKAIDIDYITRETAMILGTGTTHTDDFPLDAMGTYFREEFASRYVVTGKWRLTSTEEEIRRYVELNKSEVGELNSVHTNPTKNGGLGGVIDGDETENITSHAQPNIDQNADNQGASPEMQPSSKGQKSHPKAKPAGPLSLPQDTSKIPTLDQEEIPEDFDPCDYFRKAIDALSSNMSSSPKTTDGTVIGVLDFASMFEGIASVVRVLNELHALGHGFTVTTSNGRKASSIFERGLSAHDQIVLHLQPFNPPIMLLLIGFKTTMSGKNAAVYVVDSAPGTRNLYHRQQFYITLQREWQKMFDVPIPATLNWTYGPQQLELSHSGYFAVLNAWSILLDLQPNTTDFVPSESFFVDFMQLLDAVRRGNADWKLIWAFLRCKEYVLEQSPPAPNRRFTKTINVHEIPQHEKRLQAKQDSGSALPKAQSRYVRFTQTSTFRHNEPSPWDEFDAGDIKYIQELKRSGKYKSDLSESQIRNLWAGLPENFRACVYLRQALDDKLNDPKTRADLKEFRSDSEHVTTEFRYWLEDDEVTLAVAAVTLSITQQSDLIAKGSDPFHGFGFIPQSFVRMVMDHRDVELPQTVRSGCPMLLPINIAQHYILLIIRLDENGLPEFSVMDSKGYHLNQWQRQEVHDAAYTIAEGTDWYERIIPGQAMEDHTPTHTTWLPASQQPSDDECAYYVIMNAWSLALGLQPDPSVHLQWTDQFFQDLQDIVHLARLGKATWQMIYAFLLCYRFVQDGIVPEDRRFEKTSELPKHQADGVNRITEALADNELIYGNGRQTLLVRDLRDANRLQLPPGGKAHNRSFASDRWIKADRDIAKDLARNGKPHLECNAIRLRQAQIASRNEIGRELLDQLGAMIKQSQSHDMRETCRRYLQDWHAGRDLMMAAAPCDMLRDTLHFYYNLFADDAVEEILRNEAFEDEEDYEDDGNLFATPMNPLDVNLSLSAVIEAIDRFQSEEHMHVDPEADFAGGFALSTSERNIVALSRQPAGVVSRPRRCLIMPLFYGGLLHAEEDQWRLKHGMEALDRETVEDGHHMLIVVQEITEKEDDVDRPVFKAVIYDSSRDIVRESHKFIRESLVHALRNLKWSTHRNANDDIEPEVYSCEERVAQQMVNQGWRSGPHTVINGWILAMGLTPSPIAFFGTAVYSQFRVIAKAAISGLLDWRTLVAWLFCHKLTLQRKLQSVPKNRRFEMTQFWESERQLSNHIDNIYEEADHLLQTVNDPYDFGNNPIHLSEYVNNEEDSDESDSDAPQQYINSAQERPGNKDLKRRFEDPTFQYDKRRVRSRRSSCKAVVHDALIFLEGYDTPGPAHLAESPRVAQLCREGGFGRDDLVFLEGY